MSARLPSMRGRTVLVTGAGSGIGRATLLRFAEAGATVIAADINTEAAERAAGLAEHFGGRALAYSVDVGDAESMQTLADASARDTDGVDVMINNAGIGVSGAFLQTQDADWEQILNVNLWSVVRGTRLFAQQMVERGNGGHIVNLASMAAYTPLPDMSAYATTKAAVRMLSDCVRMELQPHGIRVSCICPGVVDTPITTSTQFVGVDAAEQERRRQLAKRVYQRRNLKPEAVAVAIMDAVARGRDEVVVGTEAAAARWMNRLAPGTLRRLAGASGRGVFDR